MTDSKHRERARIWLSDLSAAIRSGSYEGLEGSLASAFSDLERETWERALREAENVGTPLMTKGDLWEEGKLWALNRMCEAIRALRERGPQ